MQKPLFQGQVAFVTPSGQMTAETQRNLNLLSNAMPIVGSGSPEGVVEALQYSLYIDRDGTAGNIEWRKMSAAVGGDSRRGWVRV